MHGVPGEGVMLCIVRIALHGSDHHGSQTDEHGDGKDDDQQWQQHDEGKRAEDEAQRDGFPAELLELESDRGSAVVAVFDEDMVAAQPDEQGAQGLPEGPQEGGFHPADLPDTVEIAVNKTRFGVVGTDGLLKRGRLSSLRFRDRVHRFGWLLPV